MAAAKDIRVGEEVASVNSDTETDPSRIVETVYEDIDVSDSEEVPESSMVSVHRRV